MKKEILYDGWVCADRYPYDCFLRMGDDNNNLLKRVLYYILFPKPRYVFLFMGSAKIISNRKNELTEIEVAKTIRRYRKFLKLSGICFSEIDTTENNKEECKDAILKHICSFSL